MAMIVQHNITAMNASRMLGVTTGVQAKTSEKLASGYRINRAADDAAGLSISEKMRSQIRGLDRASTNAQDGVSAVQTAEGALTEVHSMLQRMNELAVQSANGTNSDIDRDAIQAEIKQLTEEIDRVAESTKFNETYLLKGDEAAGTKTVYSYKTVDIEAEFSFGDGVTSLFKADGTELTDEDAVIAALEADEKLYTEAPQITNQAAGDAAEEDTDYEMVLVGAEGGTTGVISGISVPDGTAEGTYTYYDKNADGDALDNPGFYSLQPGTGVTDATPDVAFTYTGTPTAGTTTITVTEEVNLLNDKLYAEGDLTALSEEDAKDAIANGDTLYTVAATSSQTEAVAGTDYTYTPATKDLAVLYDENGKELAASDIDEYLEEGKTLYADAAKTEAVAEADLGDYTNSATVNEDLTLSLHVGADSDDTNKIEISISSMSAAGIGVNGLNVSTSEDATAAIDTIKAAIQQVSNQRSALGAIQNRLEHTIANLDNVVENTTSAESRIRDTDMAEEMVEYSKNQILAQAGQSMLAQANQSTQGVLSLLQ